MSFIERSKTEPFDQVIVIGFTGTREGMTSAQKNTFAEILRECIYACEFHHGMCIGADEDAHHIVTPLLATVGHPGRASNGQCPCLADVVCDEECRALPYLDRNKEIVDNCDLLIACPKGPETLRSGTWSTVREARKVDRRYVVIMPDGDRIYSPQFS